jgi:hypothetical protein
MIQYTDKETVFSQDYGPAVRMSDKTKARIEAGTATLQKIDEEVQLAAKIAFHAGHILREY